MTQTPQFGFVIDHRKCIGCHACTVACKSENDVPLAKFRTWVKYVDKGTFPDVRRHFTVLRCNHCDAAPCVTICPVNALHKRKDAIVDLDRDACIGCRACMQACPYDALYLNEDTGVAEKCHYCAHRTERRLEPACVVVCPERAIIAGDVADPNTEIAQIITKMPTSQRKLEKGTKPRVWYVDALPEALKPGTATEPPSYLWSDRASPQPPPVPTDLTPPPDLITSLDVSHPPVWGWHIWSYLLTKNVAAGVAIVAPFLVAFGAIDTVVLPEIVALLFLGMTMFLLIHDLGRPERFLKILLTPNTQSWLVKGGWVLTAFGALLGGGLVLRLMGMEEAADLCRWVNVPVAVMTSGYTAFLFYQCRGRDLWHGKTLFPDLVARAVLLGAGFGLMLPAADGAFLTHRRDLFIYALLAVLALTQIERLGLPKTDHAVKAHDIFVRKDGLRSIWALMAAGFIGVLLRDDFLPEPGIVRTVLTALPLCIAAIALFVREKAFVEAGQEVPIS